MTAFLGKWPHSTFSWGEGRRGRHWIACWRKVCTLFKGLERHEMTFRAAAAQVSVGMLTHPSCRYLGEREYYIGLCRAEKALFYLNQAKEHPPSHSWNCWNTRLSGSVAGIVLTTPFLRSLERNFSLSARLATAKWGAFHLLHSGFGGGVWLNWGKHRKGVKLWYHNSLCKCGPDVQCRYSVGTVYHDDEWSDKMDWERI